MDYACGTNGGPPACQLTGWKDFRRCRAEPSGLREVYFRYDDEMEYWAKANNLGGQMEQYVGTKTYGFPIKVSALIGEDGRGPRHPHRLRPARSDGDRDEAYCCAISSMPGSAATTGHARTSPPSQGETAVTSIFIKQRCEKDVEAAARAVILTRHLRKPGQSQYDPHSGKETTNQFESNVRFEFVRR